MKRSQSWKGPSSTSIQADQENPDTNIDNGRHRSDVVFVSRRTYWHTKEFARRVHGDGLLGIDDGNDYQVENGRRKSRVPNLREEF